MFPLLCLLWRHMTAFRVVGCIILCCQVTFRDSRSQEKTVRESTEQKAITCDLQEQPKLICLWLDALLSKADRCRLALLKLWLNCTQLTGYLMTGALLTMSRCSLQTAALAGCRLLKTSTECAGSLSGLKEKILWWSQREWRSYAPSAKNTWSWTREGIRQSTGAADLWRVS